MIDKQITIDLRKKDILNESWLRMFGANIVDILKAMFGGYSIPVNIVGTQSQINTFADALNREKKYIEAYKRYGLDNPYTYKNKSLLQQSIKNFENKTGIIWPLK